MRLAAFLVFLSVPLLSSTQADPALQAQVDAIAAKHEGGLTLYAEDLASGKSVAIQPDRRVQTASVIKLAILYEALEQIRQGKASFGDALTLKKEYQVQGSGVLLFFDTPHTLTLKDALTLMIVMSDNTATNLVIDHLGLAAIDDRIQSLGLHGTYLYKKVFVKASGNLPPDRAAEQKQFGLGSTTAHEMATLMKDIYTCDLGGKRDGDAELCAAALTMLGNQFYRDCIPRYLDGWNAPGTGGGPAIGNKSGSLDDVRNDVGVLATGHGPIFISAFTFDNKDQSWTVDNRAEVTIAKLAQAIAKAWSPNGLAPDRYNHYKRAENH